MPRFTCDRIGYNITQREYTDEGFLRVPGRVAKADNVQEYYAKELGITDGDPLQIIRVFRPSSEVFNPESLDSYMGADVTDDHPSQIVDTDTYNAVSRGVSVSRGRQDGDFVVCDLIIKDKKTIKAVESGKVQLSAGYTADYEKSPGVSPAGQSYDYIQRNIKINHVALVDRARAGGQARLFDNKGDHKMPIVTLDKGRIVTLDNEANAALISDHIGRLNELIELQSTTITDSEKTIDTLTKQTSDASITKRVATIVTTMDTARYIAGKSFACDSVDVVEIQRSALTAIGRKNLDGKNASYIQGVFDAEKESVDEDMEEMRDMLKEKGADMEKVKDMSLEEMKDMLKESKDEDEDESTNDSHRRFASDANPIKDKKKTSDSVSPYQQMKLDRANAHKGKE